MIKENIQNVKCRITDYMRRKCTSLSEGKRIAVIVGMILFMSVSSVYLTVSSIYRLGRQDGERLKMEHVRQLQVQGNDTIQSIHKPKEYAGK